MRSANIFSRKNNKGLKTNQVRNLVQYCRFSALSLAGQLTMNESHDKIGASPCLASPGARFRRPRRLLYIKPHGSVVCLRSRGLIFSHTGVGAGRRLDASMVAKSVAGWHSYRHPQRGVEKTNFCGVRLMVGVTAVLREEANVSVLRRSLSSKLQPSAAVLGITVSEQRRGKATRTSLSLGVNPTHTLHILDFRPNHVCVHRVLFYASCTLHRTPREKNDSKAGRQRTYQHLAQNLKFDHLSDLLSVSNAPHYQCWTDG